MKTFSAEFGVNGESVYEYQRSHLFMVNKNTDLYFTRISHGRISVPTSKSINIVQCIIHTVISYVHISIQSLL
ncbi:hypothetical protein V1477_008423 [Vespula maculifrons]|uniref:Uncharacterized protein n=1 Tax=Vespula maculifrons TaxID=7453 RepID=A0ABD2CDW0_VESMC